MERNVIIVKGQLKLVVSNAKFVEKNNDYSIEKLEYYKVYYKIRQMRNMSYIEYFFMRYYIIYSKIMKQKTE